MSKKKYIIPTTETCEPDTDNQLLGSISINVTGLDDTDISYDNDETNVGNIWEWAI